MALTRETVEYRGQYFKYFNVPIEMRPYQTPHPPLWYASGSTDGAAWAGSQNHNVAFLAPTSRARVLIDAYKNGRAAAEGLSSQPMPKIGITRHLYIAETDEVAHAEGKRAYLDWYEKFAWLCRNMTRDRLPRRMSFCTATRGGSSRARRLPCATRSRGRWRRPALIISSLASRLAI